MLFFFPIILAMLAIIISTQSTTEYTIDSYGCSAYVSDKKHLLLETPQRIEAFTSIDGVDIVYSERLHGYTIVNGGTVIREGCKVEGCDLLQDGDIIRTCSGLELMFSYTRGGGDNE